MRELESERPHPVGCTSLANRCVAIQLTQLNRVSVIAWIRKRGSEAGISREGIMVWLQDSRPRHAFLDDWVVYTEGGVFLIIPTETFDQAFKVVAGPLPRRRKKLIAS